MDAYRRTKKDVFHDATVSLLFALQFDVNVEESAGDGPDRQARIETFSEWIDMLRKCGVFNSLFTLFRLYSAHCISDDSNPK